MEEMNDPETTENTLELHPYRFEPLLTEDDNMSEQDSDFSLDDNEDDIEDTNTDRIGNTTWCLCGHCSAMETGRESVCCRENNLISDRMEGEDIQCFTMHDGFLGNCLNRYVIETSLFAYIQEVSPIDDNELPHKTYRYIAYRNFTRFIYHRLRKYERKVIPSCCVNKIRCQFPSQEFCGFRYARP